MPDSMSNEFYALLNFLPIPIMVSREIAQDAAGNQVNRICFLNTAFNQIIGYTLEDIPDPEAWHSKAFPVKAYRQKVINDWNKISAEKLSRSENVIEFTARIFCGDGQYRWFEITNELRSSIRPNYNVSVFKDVTKLHEMYDDLKAKSMKISEQTTEIEFLRKIIPICSFCKKVRDDNGQWHEVETYIKERSGADLSHGLCSECFENHYPDIYARCKDSLSSDGES